MHVSLEALLEGFPLASAVINKDGMITHANQLFNASLGYEDGILHDLPLGVLSFPPRETLPHSDSRLGITSILSGGLRTSSGTYRSFDFSCKEIDVDGATLYLVTAMPAQNLATPLRHAVMELKHDMKNSLGAITMASAGLGEIVDFTDGIQRQMAGVIQHSAEHIVSLVDDALGALTEECVYKAVNYGEILTKIKDECQYTFPRGIIRLPDSASIPDQACADEAKLRRAFTNLIRNALLVDLEVTVDFTPTPSHYVFTFSNKTPIPSDVLPNLLQKSVRSRTNGTGKGLMYAREAIAMNRGYLHFSSCGKTEFYAALSRTFADAPLK